MEAMRNDMDIFRIERFSDQMAIWTAGREITYLQLADMSDAAVCNLKSNELAAIECANQLDVLAAYIGCQRRRIPVLLVDAGLSSGMREELYRRYQISVVFSSSIHAWCRRDTLPPRMHSDLALLLSTSGSTGSPKMVRLSRRNLLSNAMAIAEYLHLNSQGRAITSLPLHYAYGLSVIHSHLLVGATIVVCGHSVMEREFWRCMEEAGVSLFSGAPIMYEALQKLQLEKMRLPALKILTQAGGKLPVRRVEWMARLAQTRGWKFYVMYGQTEATARMAYLPHQYAIEYPESIGMAIPGGMLSLEDDSGRVIEESGVTGQLIYRGDNVMMGYALSASDLLLGDVNQGRLMTGDLAVRDENDFYYLRGRSSRVIKLYGSRIDLDYLESDLRNRGMDVVIAGQDDRLVLAAIAKHHLDEALHALTVDYRIHRALIGAVVLDAIPMTSSGKIRYGDLLQTGKPGFLGGA
jgi:long-chain acyl-CoA synthetase